MMDRTQLHSFQTKQTFGGKVIKKQEQGSKVFKETSSKRRSCCGQSRIRKK